MTRKAEILHCLKSNYGARGIARVMSGAKSEFSTCNLEKRIRIVQFEENRSRLVISIVKYLSFAVVR